MSHHILRAPGLRTPRGDARLQLADVFAFPGTDAPGRTVLVLDVHPFATAHDPGFHPDAVYRINIDNDGDNRADVAFSFVFSDPELGGQTVTVHRAVGVGAQKHEPVGDRILVNVPVAFGDAPDIVEAGGYRVSAGLRSDPFFADLDGLADGHRWTGRDSLAAANVFAVAVEVPDTDLGPVPTIGIWARISLRRHGRLVAVDRGAHPLLTEYFEPEAARDAYSAGEPAEDWRRHHEAWTEVLQRTGAYTTQAATETLGLVLPDILHYDRARPAGYPNGRTLVDDVVTARLTMLTGATPTGRHVPPHDDLLPTFPHLGHPHGTG
ncbi:DUF4331 family protein [Kitasatospora sp. NPDC054939]